MFRIRQAAKREMQIATTTTITTKTTSTKRFGVWTWNDARKTKIARQKTAKRNKRIYKTHTHTHAHRQKAQIQILTHKQQLRAAFDTAITTTTTTRQSKHTTKTSAAQQQREKIQFHLLNSPQHKKDAQKATTLEAFGSVVSLWLLCDAFPSRLRQCAAVFVLLSLYLRFLLLPCQPSNIFDGRVQKSRLLGAVCAWPLQAYRVCTADPKRVLDKPFAFATVHSGYNYVIFLLYQHWFNWSFISLANLWRVQGKGSSWQALCLRAMHSGRSCAISTLMQLIVNIISYFVKGSGGL